MKQKAERLDLSNADEAFRARFWSKVDVGHRTSCWPWTAYCKPGGYGQFTLRKGRFITASRVAFALSKGPIPPALFICHTCDNPPCCNPAHLFAGTSRDNVIDSVRKGRANRAQGVATAASKLTPDAVRTIRATPVMFGTRARLAREYGVDWHQIDDVLRGEAWKTVE